MDAKYIPIKVIECGLLGPLSPHKLPKGGRFAAWEQPQLYSEEVRTGFEILAQLVLKHGARMWETPLPECARRSLAEPTLPGSAEAIRKLWAEREKMARSDLRADVDIELWCRHCKCAIERASSFERIDELVAFVATDSCQGKIKPDRVE
jgi:hypothetical protein